MRSNVMNRPNPPFQPPFQPPPQPRSRPVRLALAAATGLLAALALLALSLAAPAHAAGRPGAAVPRPAVHGSGAGPFGTHPRPPAIRRTR